MRIKRLPIKQLLLGAAVLVVAGLFVACGGGDDDDGDDVHELQPGEIRTEKGLAVAAQANALGANFGAGTGESADGGARADIDVGAPAEDATFSAGVSQDLAYPYYFPQAATGGVGLTVQGYGSATAAADSAVIEIYFYRDGYDIEPVPLPVEPDGGDGSSSSGSSGDVDADFAEPDPVEPITEDDLQPVIDALNAAGADEVEFVSDNYYERYYSSASLRATFNGTDGVEDAIDGVIDAANGLDNVFYSGNNMYFTVSDCSALERAAMEAALEDAGERGDVLADVIGAGRGEIIGASNYTYSPYGDGSCSSSYYGYGYDVLEADGEAPGPTDVQVFAALTVTYAIN
jgi:uncharacterized protein YggE